VPPLNSIRALIRATSGADDVARAVKPIRAYHGSPHNFDRFDASKIGTGEGAQAYGHGLYFAGAEDVARTYRDISPAVPSDEAAKAIQEMHRRAVQLELEASRIRDAMEQAAAERGTLSPGWGTIRDVPQDVQQSLGPRLKEIGAQLSALRMEQQRARDGLRGHMYEVELGVPEGTLMDWDAPLSSQPQNFMQVLRAYDAVPELPSSVPWEPVGEQAYRRLVDRISMSGPARKGQMPPARAAVAAADALRSGGVLGMRYLDAGSRSAGQGTHNYVMFPGTEDSIRILRKYGLLAPMALPALQEGE